MLSSSELHLPSEVERVIALSAVGIIFQQQMHCMKLNMLVDALGVAVGLMLLLWVLQDFPLCTCAQLCYVDMTRHIEHDVKNRMHGGIFESILKEKVLLFDASV